MCVIVCVCGSGWVCKQRVDLFLFLSFFFFFFLLLWFDALLFPIYIIYISSPLFNLFDVGNLFFFVETLDISVHHIGSPAKQRNKTKQNKTTKKKQRQKNKEQKNKKRPTFSNLIATKGAFIRSFVKPSWFHKMTKRCCCLLQREEEGWEREVSCLNRSYECGGSHSK